MFYNLIKLFNVSVSSIFSTENIERSLRRSGSVIRKLPFTRKKLFMLMEDPNEIFNDKLYRLGGKEIVNKFIFLGSDFYACFSFFLVWASVQLYQILLNNDYFY